MAAGTLDLELVFESQPYSYVAACGGYRKQTSCSVDDTQLGNKMCFSAERAADHACRDNNSVFIQNSRQVRVRVAV